jgi:hypothetical protein
MELEPQVMDLLVYLAEAKGEVRSKDEIASALWPGASVNDDALSRTVWKLRQALGDDAKSPRYVQTVSRRGYRLLETVEPVTAHAPDALGQGGRAGSGGVGGSVDDHSGRGEFLSTRTGRRRARSLPSRQTMRPWRCWIPRGRLLRPVYALGQ